MKAHYLLKQNIDTLLRARGQKRRELAAWCRRSESWLSQIFIDEERNIPLKYLDRIADFFGLATYQLFQPGISPLTERRKGLDRRVRPDRRVSRVTDSLQAPPRYAEVEAKLRHLTDDQYRMVARWVEALAALPLGTEGPLGLPATAPAPAATARRTRARRQGSNPVPPAQRRGA